MIQQVVTRCDAPKHFPDASGGFGFVARPSGARSWKPALRCSRHFGEPEEATSRRTCASACESASTPHRTLPIRSGKTNRKRPARVFLSACIAAIKRAGEAFGHGGRGPTRVIRLMSRAESRGESILLETASFEAATIPQ